MTMQADIAAAFARLTQAVNNAAGRHEPVFAYGSDGKLSTITYSDAATKTFNYAADGKLNTLVFSDGSVTLTKTFNYTDGVLTSITEAVTGG